MGLLLINFSLYSSSKLWASSERDGDLRLYSSLCRGIALHAGALCRRSQFQLLTFPISIVFFLSVASLKNPNPWVTKFVSTPGPSWLHCGVKNSGFQSHFIFGPSHFLSIYKSSTQFLMLDYILFSMYIL